MRRKPQKKRKRPVLTSPWKIGMLVSLLLVVLSVGVGYYIVRTYHVELRWLSIDGLRWSIDSFMFFREMYVLVAAVIGISVISYFLVASAVRRYESYLASGQDYRKMISLADSIDDLTNPAQIARLSAYPELQAVLRNYGDQIREVSKELERREQEQERECRSVDLEMEIESLLKGERTEGTVVEGKWWAPLFKKLETYTKDNREIISGIEQRVEQLRGLLGGAVLSEGKIMEALGGASEEIATIARAAGELDGLTDESAARAGDEPESDGASGGGDAGATVQRMESALQRLDSEKQVFSELFEENNGLALGIALTAARGGAGDKDLAKFAESARTTAERFKKLGKEFTGIAAELTCCCRSFGRGAGGGGGSVGTATMEELSGISRRIERSCASLKLRFATCTNELGDMSNLLHQGLSKLDATVGAAGTVEGREQGRAGAQSDEASIVNFGVGPENEADDDSFVIDHGKLWEDEPCDGAFVEPAAAPECATADDEAEEVRDAAAPILDPGKRDEVEAAGAAEGAADAEEPEERVAGTGESEEDSDREQDRVRHARGTPAQATGTTGESWMEMPGHRWLKIDVEKSKREEAVDIEVREDRETPPEGGAAMRAPKSARAGRESWDAPGALRDEKQETDDEPIHDLFELGAVEYVEERADH